MKGFLSHWKTSVQGFLSFALATLTTISGFLGSLNLVSSAPSIHTVSDGIRAISTITWIVLGLNLSIALCKAWIGLLQKDPGTTEAVLPGDPKPQLVSAHEVPDNPEAIPVTKETQP